MYVIAGDHEHTWLGGGVKSQLLCLVTKLAFVRSGVGSHIMIQSAGLVLTTLNGFVIVWSGNRCCVVLFDHFVDYT